MALFYDRYDSNFIIKIENLFVKQNQNDIFKNFNLQVEENQIIGIYAPTGSGKSTLLNLIAGLDIPSDFEVNGNIKIKKNYNISYVFQEPRLIENQTVLKNILLPVSKKYVCSKKVNDVLQILDLENKQKQLVSKLSGGEKQRVSIARALLYDSQIILLDEPFNSQDESKKNKIMSFIKNDILTYNKTCLFVSHNLDEIKNFTSKILTLKDFK